MLGAAIAVFAAFGAVTYQARAAEAEDRRLMISLVGDVLHELALIEKGQSSITDLRHAVARAKTALKWVAPGNAKVVRAYLNIERMEIPDNLEQELISLAPSLWSPMLASVNGPAERASATLKK